MSYKSKIVMAGDKTLVEMFDNKFDYYKTKVIENYYSDGENCYIIYSDWHKVMDDESEFLIDLGFKLHKPHSKTRFTYCEIGEEYNDTSFISNTYEEPIYVENSIVCSA